MIDSILAMDESLYVFINSHLSNGLFDFILVPLRHKLFWVPLYLFLISFIIHNYLKKSWLVFLGIIITMVLSDTMSSKVIKKSVKRIRPCHMEQLTPVKRVPCSNGFSFTSSHATNHFALGTFFFLLFSFTAYRFLFLVWAGVISFAQVYVGVHYPVDVICGALLGILIGFISFKFLQFLNSKFYLPKTQLV